jgi:hypothetical protein
MGAVGGLVPLVLIPKFTSYIGNQTLSSAPLDVSGYSGGSATATRGPIIGAHPSVKVTLQESQDGLGWTDLVTFDLSVAASDDQDFTISRRWLRVQVDLRPTSGSDPLSATLWCLGTLTRRTS